MHGREEGIDQLLQTCMLRDLSAYNGDRGLRQPEHVRRRRYLVFCTASNRMIWLFGEGGGRGRDPHQQLGVRGGRMRIKLFNKPGVEAILNVRPENPARFRFSLWVAHSLPRGGTEHCCGSMHGTLGRGVRGVGSGTVAADGGLAACGESQRFGLDQIDRVPYTGQHGDGQETGGWSGSSTRGWCGGRRSASMRRRWKRTRRCGASSGGTRANPTRLSCGSLAEASGVETPTRADLARFDRSRKNKKTSNNEWKSPRGSAN